MPEVFILGAGVVGMTSAYALARKGLAVTVIDAGRAPAERGASFGNGAQLSYSYTDALSSPSLVRNLPGYLLGLDPAFRLRPTASPQLWRWALAFLANASRTRFEANTVEVLKLAMESRRGFAEIADRIDFDHRRTGKLNLYVDHDAMRAAERLRRLKNAHGVDQILLSRDEAIEREPALSSYGRSFVGALWSPLDEAGDSWRFCQGLKHLLQHEYGVRFRLATTVEALTVRAGRLVAVRTDRGELTCARAIVCLGAQSRGLVRPLGIDLPIWPMQGYSLTVRASERAPLASITDTGRKVVFCRIGDRLRIAGLADIGAGNGAFDQRRFDILLHTAKDLFPEAGDYDADLHAWTGVRPMTPDNRPIVAPSKVRGLYLNCGHGSLGWTLSMGAAARLAALLPDDI